MILTGCGRGGGAVNSPLPPLTTQNPLGLCHYRSGSGLSFLTTLLQVFRGPLTGNPGSGIPYSLTLKILSRLALFEVPENWNQKVRVEPARARRARCGSTTFPGPCRTRFGLLFVTHQFPPFSSRRFRSRFTRRSSHFDRFLHSKPRSPCVTPTGRVKPHRGHVARSIVPHRGPPPLLVPLGITHRLSPCDPTSSRELLTPHRLSVPPTGRAVGLLSLLP